MSDNVTKLAAAHSHPTGGAALASPDFDRQEINSFGKDDGHAIAVIGKMLVLFFFYSLLVMSIVAGWSFWGMGHSEPAVTPHHHDASTADF